MAVAQEGEAAEPRVSAPAALRPLLTFTRLSATAHATIAKVVDDDDAFRARVAEAAPDESTGGIGRAGWLWLHRPEGWQRDPAWTGDHAAPAGEAGSKQRRQQAAAEAKAARHRQAASAADDARRRAIELLADARRAAEEAADERDRLRARLDELEAERNRAVRTSKSLEADLAASRRDLKVAREAARQAEAELLAGRVGPAAADEATDRRRPRPRPAPDPVPAEATTVVEPLDRAAVAGAVGSAAAASADLAQAVARAASASTALAKALAAAAVLLAPPPTTAPSAPALEVGEHRARGVGSGTTANAKGAKGSKGLKGSKGRRPRRVAPTLPPGVFADTPEAHRHVLGSGEPMVVVDGYNVARTAWPDLAPEEERRRTVALLEELQARSGGPVVVVFDGDDAAVAPVASRSVRVRFSATGVTADDHIAELVADLPPGQPVVVVSSDKEVAAEGRRLGAVVLSSPELLAAVGR